MALKAQVNNNLDYLNKLCSENGIEIKIPDLNKKDDVKDKKNKHTKK